MDIADILCQYLDDANFGVVGTSIFPGQIPNDTNGIYIVRVGGTPNMYTSIEESVCDIYVKDSSSKDAITLLERIKRAIHRSHSISVTVESNTAYIHSLLVIGDVQDVARDLEYSKVYKITVQTLSRDTALIS